MAGKLSFLVEVDSSKGIAEINRTGNALKNLGHTGQAAGETAAGALERLFNHTFRLNQALELAERAFRYFISPIEKLVNIGANFETLQNQLEIVLQSAQKGKEYFEWIKDFAAKTPFRMEELTKGVIMLENFGISAKKHLETVGNTAAALNTNIAELSKILGKVYARPNASMEEMLQLIERGVPVFKILQEQLGLTAKQVSEIGKAGVSGKQVFDALMAGMERYYGGAMDRLSKTWAGMWSTLQDEITIALNQVAAPLIENLKKRLQGILDQLDKWSKDGTLERWANQAVNLITGLIDALTTTGKVLWALKDIIIVLGEAWAVGFAANKLSPFLKGLENISDYYKVLRLEGGGAFKSFSGAAGEAFSNFKTQFKDLPTGIKFGIAFAVAGIALEMFDKGVKFLEETMGVKYSGPGEFLGNFKYVVNVATGGMLMSQGYIQGTLEKQADAAFNALKERFKLNVDEIQNIMRTAKVKFDPFNVPQMEKDFQNALQQIENFKRSSIQLYNTSIDKLSETGGVIGLLGKQLASLLPPTEKARQAAEKERLETEKATLAKLAAEAAWKEFQNEVVKTAEKLGFFSGSTADLDHQTRILQEALKLAGGQFGSNKEAIGKVIKEVESLKASYIGMGTEVPAVLDSISQKAKIAKINLSQIEIPEVSDEEIEKGMEKILREAEKIKSLSGSLEGVNIAFDYFDEKQRKIGLVIGMMTGQWEKYFDAINNKNIIVGLNESLVEQETRIKNALFALALLTGQWNYYWAAISAGTKPTLSLRESLEEVSKFCSGFGGVLTQAAGQLGDLGIISERVAQKMTSVGQGIGTIGAGIQSFNQVGASIFDNISGGLSVVTGAISIAVTLFGNLFKRDWEGEAALMLSSLGGATDAMKKKLAELAQEMGNTQEAFNRLMAEFIDEAEIETREQFLTWLRKMYTLLGEVKNNGSIQDIKDLNDAFEALVAKGEQFGLLGAEFNTLVDRIQATGVQLDALTNFINNSLKKASDGLKQYIQSGIDTNQQFQNAVGMTITLFNSLINNGVSKVDAFRQMQDIFTGLFDSALKSGYQMSSAFRELYEFQQKVSKNSALIDGITGFFNMLTNLANSGVKLSQEALNDFSFSAKDSYDRLIKAGFSGSEALSMIAPVLTNLQYLAGRYNLTIDAGTQSLIDQAKQQGLISEKTKTDSQVIIGLLGAIAEALGAKIPQELQTVMAASSQAAQMATADVEKWQGGYTALGEEISGIPVLLNNAGNTNEAVTTDIIEQNQEIIKNLSKIGDQYYTNTKALEVYGQKYQGFQSVLAGTESIIDKLAGGFEYALYNMGGNTDDLAGLIDDLADKLGITLPGTLSDLQDKYKYVMAAMAQQTQNYFLGPDGVLRSLLDTLAYIGEQTQNQGGENYGVFTEAQKQEMTVEFFRKGHLWENNKNTILSSEANMRKFIQDLENLHVTDAAKGQYDKFLASMRQWYSHFEKGEKWDGSKWIAGEGGGGGGGNNFGIYTEAQKQAMTTRMNEMARYWQNNKDDIFARETNLRAYYNELEGLVVIPSAKGKWDNLMAAAGAAQKHFDAGDTWDPEKDTWKKAVHAAKGAHFTVPTYLTHLPMVVHPGERVDVWTADETANMYDFSNYPSRYIPASTETNSNQAAPVKEIVIEKGDTHYHSDNRQFTIYVPTGTSSNDKEAFRRTLLEVLEDNYGQAATKAGVYINEWGGR